MAAFVMRAERPYRSVPGLPELPCVCLRVPTGGGKTPMACHAVGTAIKEYLRQDFGLCLWLVPSKPIREQPLRALRDRNHPYPSPVFDLRSPVNRCVRPCRSPFLVSFVLWWSNLRVPLHARLQTLVTSWLRSVNRKSRPAPPL